MWEDMAKNRIMRLYLQERIEKGCEKSVHERILSDTTKLGVYKLGLGLKVLQKKLAYEAVEQGLQPREIRKQVGKEFEPKKK